MLIDVTFAILILFASIKGMRKGFVIAFFSLVAFIIGLAAALKMSAAMARKLSENLNVYGPWLPFVSYMLVFFGVVFLVNLGGRLIQKSFELVMLGWLNRVAGALVFALLYGIIFSVFLFYAIQLHMLKPATIAASVFYPYIQPLAPKIINAIGDVIPAFKNIFEQLEHFFETLSNKMQH